MKNVLLACLLYLFLRMWRRRRWKLPQTAAKHLNSATMKRRFLINSIKMLYPSVWNSLGKASAWCKWNWKSRKRAGLWTVSSSKRKVRCNQRKYTEKDAEYQNISVTILPKWWKICVTLSFLPGRRKQVMTTTICAEPIISTMWPWSHCSMVALPEHRRQDSYETYWPRWKIEKRT